MKRLPGVNRESKELSCGQGRYTTSNPKSLSKEEVQEELHAGSGFAWLSREQETNGEKILNASDPEGPAVICKCYRFGYIQDQAISKQVHRGPTLVRTHSQLPCRHSRSRATSCPSFSQVTLWLSQGGCAGNVLRSKKSVVEELESELKELESEHTQLLETCSTEDDYNRMDVLEALMFAKKAQVEAAEEELPTAEQEAERMREKAAEEARQKATVAAAEELKQLCAEKEQLERQLEEHRKSMIQVSDAEKRNYRDTFMRPLLLRKTEVSHKISILEAEA